MFKALETVLDNRKQHIFDYVVSYLQVNDENLPDLSGIESINELNEHISNYGYQFHTELIGNGPEKNIVISKNGKVIKEKEVLIIDEEVVIPED